MSDYFEEKKKEKIMASEKPLTAKRKQELKELAARFIANKDLEDKKRYIEMRQRYAGKYDDRYQNVKKAPKEAKPIKKPKPKLTIAQKAARTAKRKRTAKKVFKAVRTFIYGKPQRKTTKRKTTAKKKK